MNALSLEKTVTKKSCRIVGRCRNAGELYVRPEFPIDPSVMSSLVSLQPNQQQIYAPSVLTFRINSRIHRPRAFLIIARLRFSAATFSNNSGGTISSAQAFRRKTASPTLNRKLTKNAGAKHFRIVALRRPDWNDGFRLQARDPIRRWPRDSVEWYSSARRRHQQPGLIET